jgi:hypothetical protein
LLRRLLVAAGRESIVIGGGWSGCTIPYAENLQGISTEIPDRLEFDFKSVISSALKHSVGQIFERTYDHGY